MRALFTMVSQSAQQTTTVVTMKNIIKRHKLKFTKLYQIAKANDFSLTQVRQMSLTKNTINRDKKLAKKEGIYFDWRNYRFDGFILMVPMLTKKTHCEVGHKAYLSKKEIPDPYKYLWPTTT